MNLETKECVEEQIEGLTYVDQKEGAEYDYTKIQYKHNKPKQYKKVRFDLSENVYEDVHEPGAKRRSKAFNSDRFIPVSEKPNIKKENKFAKMLNVPKNKLDRLSWAFPKLKMIDKFKYSSKDIHCITPYETMKIIISWISKLIKHSNVLIIDSKASFGSEAISIWFHLNCKILALETDKVNYDVLKHNINISNSATDIITSENSYKDNKAIIKMMSPDILLLKPSWGGVGYKNYEILSLTQDGVDIYELISDAIDNLKFKLVIINIPNNFKFKLSDRYACIKVPIHHNRFYDGELIYTYDTYFIFNIETNLFT